MQKHWCLIAVVIVPAMCCVEGTGPGSSGAAFGAPGEALLTIAWKVPPPSPAQVADIPAIHYKKGKGPAVGSIEIMLDWTITEKKSKSIKSRTTRFSAGEMTVSDDEGVIESNEWAGKFRETLERDAQVNGLTGVAHVTVTLFRKRTGTGFPTVKVSNPINIDVEAK
jgi:hypothetical protein